MVSAGETRCICSSGGYVVWRTYILVSEIKKKTLSHHKVRTSLQDRTLDSMFPVANPAQISGLNDSNTTRTDRPPNVSKSRDIGESECYLTSVKDLRDSVTENKHNRECLSSGSMSLCFRTKLHTFMVGRFVWNSRKAYFCWDCWSRSLPVTSAAFDQVISCKPWCPRVCFFSRRW